MPPARIWFPGWGVLPDVLNHHASVLAFPQHSYPSEGIISMKRLLLLPLIAHVLPDATEAMTVDDHQGQPWLAQTAGGWVVPDERSHDGSGSAQRSW
jgi:hypothetical protein